MPDYNLGRATGEINIAYSDTGARRAQADMAAVAAEAAALDAAMGRVNKSFDDNHRLEIATAEDLIRARGELERLKQAYQAYQQEFNVAERKQREAAQAARDILRDQADDLDAVREANNRLNVAEDEVNRKRRIASDALQEYNARYASLHAEIDKFNQAHRDASTGLSNIARNAEKAGEAIEGLNDKLSAVARILGQAGIFGLFGGAAGGALGILASGGVQALAQAMSAVVEVANSFVGAIALIPSAATAAGLAIGTLVVGFHGIGEALGSIGDPAKFIAAIKDLSPAAQQAMLTIQSFTEAFRGARDQIQESLFAPIIADIQPLVQTWLPQLMNAGKEIANQFGQSMHQVFAFMQEPAQVSSFKTFTDNLVSGFAAARNAIQPFLQAWTTLATVGSGVFERLGTAITTIANEFNNWIQRTAQSGQLLEFINRALDGFTNMGNIIRDVTFGIENMFGLFRNQNGSALENLARISAEFRNWSASAEGIGAISGFFTLIKAGAAALRPELALIGESLAIVGRTLTVLGIAIQPGLNAFFVSFRDALAGLAPFVVQLAPAINQFLTAFGQVLLQVVNSIGPRLPAFLQDMSDAFIQLMQILPPVVDLFARLLDHLTPGEVETILALTIAFKALSATIPLVRGAIIALNFVMELGPVGWTVTAIAALIVAGVALYENWDTVKAKFGELTSTFGGMTGILNTLKNAWNGVVDVIKNFWSSLTGGISGGINVVLTYLQNLGAGIADTVLGWVGQAYDWGKNFVQRFIDGIGDMFSPLTDIVNQMMGHVSDPIPQSPAKTGPLAGKSPDDLGAHFVSQFAAGMSSATPSVTAAASGVAGEAGAIGGAGFGSTSFSSAGVAGKSGQDFSQGHSGFDQWVSYITKDLSAWNNIFQEAFGLVDSIQGIVSNTVKLAADLWNGGNNPLTQPGGLFGPPQPIAQQEVPGIQNKPIPGQAPDAAFRKQGNLTGQQSVPGVPNKPIPGANSTAGVPPANPPAQTQGDAAAAPAGGTIPLVKRPDGTYTSSNPAWAHLLERESGGVPDRQQQTTDANGGPGDPNAAQGMFQITPQTWSANGGDKYGPSPAAATAEQQAEIATNILQSDPGAWGFYRHPGREDPADLRAGLTGPPPVQRPVDLQDQTTSTAGAAGPLPTFPVSVQPTKSQGGPINPNLFLVHTEEGNDNAQQLADSMKNRTSNRASYNYVIDPNTGNVIQPVAPGNEAWSVGSPGNQRSVNAVIAGSTVNWTADEWMQHQNALNSLALLAAQNAAQFNIPITQLGPGSQAGIGGHEWVSDNLGGTDHTDPGPNFPWQFFMGQVRAYAQQAGAPATQHDADTAAAAAEQGGSQATQGPRIGILGTPAPTQESQGSAALRNALDLGTTSGQDPATQFNAGPRVDPNTGQVVTPSGPAGAKDVNLGFTDLSQQNLPRNRPDRTTPAGGTPGAGGYGVAAPGGTRFGVNPITGARIPLGGRTSDAVAKAGLRPLYKPGTSFGYTSDAASQPEIPKEIFDLANQFNLKVSTDPAVSGGLHSAGFAFDFAGSPEDMDAFSNFIQGNLTPQTLELIHSNERTGQQWGIAGGQSVDKPGDKFQNYFTDQYAGHGDFGPGAHVHWATDVAPIEGEGAQTQGKRSPTTSTAGADGFGQAGDSSWMNVPQGWDLSQPIPMDIRRAHGIPDELPNMFYNAQPGTVSNIPVPPDFAATHPDAVVNQGTTSLPTGTGAIAGFTQTNDQRSPMDKWQSAFSGAASIAGDGFKIFGDVIADIGAAADMTDTLVRGFANTEDIVGFIKDIQPFLQTGADIAKTVGDVGGIVAGAGGADPTGGTAAAGAAVQLISGIVGSAFDAVNQGITLGIDIYHELGKYAGYILGDFLGGPDTGPLGGNVRMLLNTKTNQLQTYSENNPLLKNTFDVPGWQRSYTQQPNAIQGGLPPQVNIYTGPGQTPQAMMAESMWMVSTGSAPVASVAGAD